MIPSTTTLRLVKEVSGSDTYWRLARKLGGVKRYGRETPIHLMQMAEHTGIFDVMGILLQAEYPSVDEARLLATDLAAVSLPVYTRFRPYCGVVKQAIDAARAFARGECGKAALAAAHKLAQAAADKTVLAEELKPAEHWAACAVVAITDPFGRPGKMVWDGWFHASTALSMSDNYRATVEALSPILDANNHVFGMLEPHFEDRLEWLAVYRDRIREVAFGLLNKAEERHDAGAKAFLNVLAQHMEARP